MGTDLEQKIPFAAAHEIIRQGIGDLTLIGPISDLLFDQLVAAGLVHRIQAAWVGNVSAGLGHNFRRAVEQAKPRPLEMVDYSNFTLALALQAGAWGVPFLPTRSIAGSDLARENPGLATTTDPFSGETVPVVRALRPDVAILHVQKADPEGNCHLWGNLGVTPEGARAAAKVLVVAEEIVDKKTIRSDPNRTVIPGFLVNAVVHEPWGAHPSPVAGYYNRDHAFYSRYHRETRSPEGAAKWLQEWVLSVRDRRTYLERIETGKLKILAHAWSSAVDYGC